MSHGVNKRACTAVMAFSLMAATMPAFATTATAVVPPPPAVTVVASGDRSTIFGDLQVRDGVVHTFRNAEEIAAYPADGSSPGSAAEVTPVPFEWRSDGSWQSDRDAFVAAPDGSYYVRAPYLNRAAGGGHSHTFGWGVGRLAPDGTVTPAEVPEGGVPYDGRLGGTSEGIAMDPSGDGVYLGGVRSRANDAPWGLVARLPLPVAADQQAAAKIVVSADDHDPQRNAETYHPGPFPAGNGLDARTEAWLDSVPSLDVKSHALYLRNNFHYIERVDLRTHAIETVVGGPYVGSDSPRPQEGMSARTPYTAISAGPVVDRAGNIFFAEGGPNRYSSSPSTIWQVRASDGTLHRVAGGGEDPQADPGDDPTSLKLYPFDLALDPDGNLYVSSNDDGGYYRRLLRFSGVAAADTIPGAPVDVAVTSLNEALSISWKAPHDDGGQQISSYTVRAHPQGASGADQDIVRTVEAGPVSLTGLTNGTAYDVSVLATNGRGDGLAATVPASPADWQAELVASALSGSSSKFLLNASTSRAPAGATYQFWCGDSDGATGSPSGTAVSTCEYPRGSKPEGWPASVRMVDPTTGRAYEATTRVVTEDPPGTVEGSRAFDLPNPDVEVTVAPDGSLDSDTCGAGRRGVTCVNVDGARIALAAAPGTFPVGDDPANPPKVQIYHGSTDALQSELGDGLMVQGGFAVTWTPKVDLAQPLILTVTTTPASGAARSLSPARARTTGFDLGGFWSGISNGIASAGRQVVSTVGSAYNAAATAVNGLFEGAAQALRRPNASATNDVVQCWGAMLRPSKNGLTQTCDGQLVVSKDVPTERISLLNPGAGLVSGGGVTVVAAGGGNVVAAGGLNLTAIGRGAELQMAGNSVIAAGGGNVVAAGGLNVIAPGGGNLFAGPGVGVVAAGGGNMQVMVFRDPAIAVAEPADPTPPTASVTLDPPKPASGVYPFGTQVKVHLTGSAADAKTVKSVRYAVRGAQTTAYTLAAGDATGLTVAGSGTSTVDFSSLDDQLAESAPGTLEIEIAPPARPSAPTGVTGIAGADHTSMQVSWTAPSSSGDLPLTGYRVVLSDQGRIGDGGGVAAPRNVEVDAATTSTSVTGLEPGHRYVAIVVARSHAGNSAASSPSTAVATASAPQAPSGLGATAGDGSVSLSWTAPSDTGGLPVHKYVVSRATAADGPFTELGQPTTTSYTDPAATNGTTYYYRVRAVNAVGSSAESAATSATPERVLASQTITFAAPDARTYGAPDAALSATASSDLPVTFTSLSTTVCTVSGSTLHVVAAGACRIEASQAGGPSHQAATPVVREVAIARAPLTVTASNATMRKGGRTPAVAPTYAGLVGGDTVRAIGTPARCAAVVARAATTCSGVVATNYQPTYRDGRITTSRTGFAVISAPSAYWATGKAASLAVVVDGGATALSWTGQLPAGVRAVTNRKRTTLSFVGAPRSVGTSTLNIVAKRKVKKGKKTKLVTVAAQTVTLRVY